MIKNFLKNRKKSILLLLLLLFILFLIPLVAYTTGNYKIEQYSRKTKILQEIAYYTSFGLLQNKKQPEPTNESHKTKEVIEKVSISNEEIEIKGKRITHHPEMSTYLFSALFRNNSEYGIPNINIKSIKIYNEGNELIGKKTDYNPQIILVKNGEYPFHLSITNTDPNFIPTSFEIEFNITDFTINDQVVRLENVSLELIETGLMEIKHRNDYINYTRHKYELIIKNPTETPVDGIYYIGFLKHGDYAFTRSNEACCHFVSFTKEQKDINLDAQKRFAALAPQQEEIIHIDISKDYLLHLDGFKEDKITPVFYVIGVKNPELKDIYQNPPIEERKSSKK